MTTAGGSATGTKIALAAQQVAQATANAAYASPPVSMQAFDCSYFVWLVIKKINPLFIREPSGEIARDRLNFQPVAGQAQAGDIISLPHWFSLRLAAAISGFILVMWRLCCHLHGF